MVAENGTYAVNKLTFWIMGALLSVMLLGGGWINSAHEKQISDLEARVLVLEGASNKRQERVAVLEVMATQNAIDHKEIKDQMREMLAKMDTVAKAVR